MNWRVWLAIAFDLAAVALAWVLSFLLRYNFDLPPGARTAILLSLTPALLVHAIAFRWFGLYRGMWRYASLPDLKRILLAVGAAAVVLPVVLFMIARLADVPRSVLVLHPLLLVVAMGGARFAYRSWKDGHLLSLGELGAEPVLVLGAGAAGASLLRSLDAHAQWRVVGLLDDDPAKRSRGLHGVPILGRIEEVGAIAARLNVRHAVIAMPRATAGERRRAAELAAGAGLKVMTVPAYDDILAGRVSVSAIREVELEDLLGREPVRLDDAGLTALLAGQVVLVTGAGGSIGSELCRQILRFAPAGLIMVESSEFALYRVEQEFAPRAGRTRVCPIIADVRDAARIDALLAAHRPRVVFHAAAYKHVPLMEADNAAEAVRNNVAGTWTVAAAAQRHGVERFVLISTDKAVNPTNVMGASKRLAERVVQQLQREGGTRFVTVRFGNVLGSTGSVIPKFREQIARGGPVTVTHPEIIRYFMLIPEAAQLVLQAGLMGEGGEIFVLDMGEPVKIADLARDLIRLSGFSEDDIRIEYTGLRPGEKLYEELLADGEQTLPTPHPKLRVARAREAHDDAWLAALRDWLAAPGDDAPAVKRRLREFVPEYAAQGGLAQEAPPTGAAR
jgi:FlaA1/EpsC-like NDP-sugar epimerase